MDVICINDTYSDDWLLWALENNVKHPIKDKIYTMRDWKRHSNGGVGIYLNEINNPVVNDSFLFGISIEPSFNINRFRTLLNEPVKIEQENYINTI
jgi:hypothetical protein